MYILFIHSVLFVPDVSTYDDRKNDRESSKKTRKKNQLMKGLELNRFVYKQTEEFEQPFWIHMQKPFLFVCLNSESE